MNIHFAPDLLVMPPLKPLKARRRKRTRAHLMECWDCGQHYAREKSLADHRERIHNDPSLHISLKSKMAFVCPICFEPQSTEAKFENHLLNVHEQRLEYKEMVFASWNDFLDWKAKLEADTQSCYRQTQNNSVKRRRIFHCHKSGRDHGQIDSSRSGARCPAMIFMNYNFMETEYNVKFCCTHLGHAIGESPEKKKRGKRKLTLTLKGIPAQLKEDPVWMEHDYFSWCEIATDKHHSQKENQQSVNKRQELKTEYNDRESVQLLSLGDTSPVSFASSPENNEVNGAAFNNPLFNFDQLQQQQTDEARTMDLDMDKNIISLNKLLCDLCETSQARQPIPLETIQLLQSSIHSYNLSLALDTYVQNSESAERSSARPF